MSQYQIEIGRKLTILAVDKRAGYAEAQFTGTFVLPRD